jgi:hypothetical protein
MGILEEEERVEEGGAGSVGVARPVSSVRKRYRTLTTSGLMGCGVS